MPHLISSLVEALGCGSCHGYVVIRVIMLMAGVTLTPGVKNGWSFLAYLCEGTVDWRLIRERRWPLLMCDPPAVLGPSRGTSL